MNFALAAARIEQFQPVAEDIDRMFAGERRDLRVDRRDLDRDDFDLGLLQCGQIAVDRDEDRSSQGVDDHLRGLHRHAVLGLDRIRADVRREDDVLRVQERMVFARRLFDIDVDRGAGDLAAVQRLGERLLRRRCRRARS